MYLLRGRNHNLFATAEINIDLGTLSKRMPEQLIRKIAITSSCVLHRRIVFCDLFLAKVLELRTDNKWSVGYFCCEKNVTAIELVYRML